MPRATVKLTRADRIPTDYSQVHRNDALGVLVMASESRREVIAFAGRSDKPAFFLRFQTVERAEAYTAQWMASVEKRAADRAAARAVRNAPHSLKLDDVLSASWGYEQTNVNFYQVTAVVSPRMVELRPIAAEKLEQHDMMTGECVPLVGAFQGEAFRVRPDAFNNVKIESFMTASPHGYDEVAGVRVYRRARFSTSA